MKAMYSLSKSIGQQLLLCLFIISIVPLQAQDKQSQSTPTKPAKPDISFEYRFPENLKQTPDSEARLDQWYRDAKFGAFIHFGVYSVLEGAYKDRVPKPRYAEWIEVNAKMSVEEYHEVARGFNPVDFDAEEWVKVFKDAGMKYVVITSKHHDGFALYQSAVSDFNIVDYTPFKRDVIKELSEACHRNGLKFGVYYSQAQDWNEPDAPYLAPRRTKRNVLHPNLPEDFKPDFDKYLREKALPQVKELMKNYEIDLIWFDTPVDMTFDRAKLFTDVVRKYRPDCLINSRLIQGGKNRVEAKNLELFDYVSIGDKEVPTKKLSLYVESPDCVSTSYGYKSKGQVAYHDEKELIDRFVSTVCAGGNYLLNNGPMGNGQLDPEAVRLYGVIGDWMAINGESILDTRPNPFDERPEWGDVSSSKDGKTLYLHIQNWPVASGDDMVISGTIKLDKLTSKVKSAVYLANGQKADFVQEGDVLTFSLPAQPLDEYDTVIKVSIK